MDCSTGQCHVECRIVGNRAGQLLYSGVWWVTLLISALYNGVQLVIMPVSDMYRGVLWVVRLVSAMYSRVQWTTVLVSYCTVVYGCLHR